MNSALLAVVAIVVVAVAATLWRADRREAMFEAQNPPLGQFVEVDGRRVHAVVAGSGPDLVVIHGASGNLRDFTFDLVDRLSGRYRVIALDRPGAGYTDRTDPALGGPFDTRAESPAEQAALLAAAARELGAERPIVVGHSYGGAVALAWALEEEAAAAVILAGASHPWPGGLGTLYEVTGSSLGGGLLVPLITAWVPRPVVRDTIDRIFAPQAAPDGYLEEIGAGLAIRRASYRANARQVTSLYPHVEAMAERYGELDLPVEIVHGTADTIVPLDIHSRPLAEAVPDATLTVLDGVGHMPHHVRPDAVDAAIDRAASSAGMR